MGKQLKEKIPIYFLMPDAEPDGNSFMRMHHEIMEINYYFVDAKFQKVMILTEQQKMHFMTWISNTMAIFIPSGSPELWEFAGFRIKTLKGELY